MERDYKTLRTEVRRELDKRFPDMLLIPLSRAAAIYGYTDTKTARENISAPRIPNEHRILYYIGDIATDITNIILGNRR